MVSLEFDVVYDFSEDIAEVVKDGLFGFVNTEEQLVADCIYTDAYYRIVDRNGQFISEFTPEQDNQGVSVV